MLPKQHIKQLIKKMIVKLFVVKIFLIKCCEVIGMVFWVFNLKMVGVLKKTGFFEKDGVLEGWGLEKTGGFEKKKTGVFLKVSYIFSKMCVCVCVCVLTKHL